MPASSATLPSPEMSARDATIWSRWRSRSSSTQKRVHSQIVGAESSAASGMVSEKKSASMVGPVVGRSRRLPCTSCPSSSVWIR